MAFYGRRDWLAMSVVIYDERDIISGKTQSLYAYILSEHPEWICFLDQRALFCGVLFYHHLHKSISVQMSMRRSDVFISKKDLTSLPSNRFQWLFQCAWNHFQKSTQNSFKLAMSRHFSAAYRNEQ